MLVKPFDIKRHSCLQFICVYGTLGRNVRIHRWFVFTVRVVISVVVTGFIKGLTFVGFTGNCTCYSYK